MPRPSRPWFRFYVESMNDRKLRRLTPTQRWLWVAILAAARQSTSPGVLLVAEGIPMTHAELADYAGVKLRDVREGVAEMTTLGMVGVEGCGALVVRRWNERQFESDDVTARTAKHRSLERSNDVPGNAPETETEQSKAEREAKPSRRKPEVPLPDDWMPSQQLREWAKAEYPHHATKGVLESFKDNAKKKDLRHRDWDAAFRMWIRNEAKWHPAPAVRAEKSGPSRTFL